MVKYNPDEFVRMKAEFDESNAFDIGIRVIRRLPFFGKSNRNVKRTILRGYEAEIKRIREEKLNEASQSTR